MLLHRTTKERGRERERRERNNYLRTFGTIGTANKGGFFNVVDELYQVAEVLFDASSTQKHSGGFVEDGIATFDFQFGVAEGRRGFALVLQRKLSRCRRVPHQKGTRSVATPHVLLPYLRSYRITMEPFLSHNWRNLNHIQSIR